ncbi:MAG: hypothetical protein SGJ24_02920 [Chloroflexota bacterium]|nr:hypothetical protein [Chloroflexota bacterium]
MSIGDKLQRQTIRRLSFSVRRSVEDTDFSLLAASFGQVGGVCVA